jgi:hypothetical protein
MDMSFNFRADFAAEAAWDGPLVASFDGRVSQWLVAEVAADLAEELTRRRENAKPHS